MSEELDRRGERTRRAVLGDAHVDRARADTTGFTAPFQQYVTRAAWGEVWSRPGLDLATRSCLTLAILATLRCEEELAMHVAAAVRLGVTAEQIREVLLHTTVYAGAPAGNAAFAVAARVLAELGVAE
jgi:4-carboxymuconolactone decarboxylase